MRNDGNGYAAGPNGTSMWGKYGAAGLLLITHSGSVLLQHRAPWTNQGGTWALPGGARDSHETAAEAALRETHEETGIAPESVTVHTELVTAGPFPADPNRPDIAGDWTYTTVIGSTAGELATEANEESLELAWVPLNEVANYPLLPAFAAAWPRIRQQAEADLTARKNPQP